MVVLPGTPLADLTNYELIGEGSTGVVVTALQVLFRLFFSHPTLVNFPKEICCFILL